MIGFGCEQLGGFNWGKVDQREVEAAVTESIEKGVTFFDTADCYGKGESERRLGEALHGKRDRATIATKGGVRFQADGKVFFDNSRAWLNQAVDESLQRLGTDYLDVYLIHYRDEKTPWDDLFGTLEKLVEKGKIRAYGLSNLSAGKLPSEIPALCAYLEIEFSLANRKHESFLRQVIQETKLVPVFYGCLGQGILTGKYDANAAFDKEDRRSQAKYVNFHGDKLKANLRIVEAMREISERTGRPLSQIAIRWILDYLGQGMPLIGIKRKAHLKDTLEALTWKLSREDVERLDKVCVG